MNTYPHENFARKILLNNTYIYITDKRTDAWWDIFMIGRINFELLAVGWAGLGCGTKGVGRL